MQKSSRRQIQGTVAAMTELLIWIMKWGVFLVVLLSILEGIGLSLLAKRRGERYDWIAAGISLFDFVVREIPMRLLLPMALYGVLFYWIYQYRFFTLAFDQWWHWLLAFLVVEFLFYCYHRTVHRVRWFWCSHSVHHSPAQVNLAAAGRFGFTMNITGIPLFYAPAPLLGVPPTLVVALTSASLFYQFFLHNTWMPRLGPLEWVFNTPSAHRVHHGANLEYLDGNYGGVVIIFDRLLGTYIPERDDIRPNYGLVNPVKQHNFIDIEFGRWIELFRDLRGSRSVRAFFGYLLRPPGWVPEGPGNTTEELRARAAAADKPSTPYTADS